MLPQILNHVHKPGPTLPINQATITTIGSNKTGAPITKPITPISDLLLTSDLHHFPMRVRVLSRHKRRASSGSVFRYQPTRLVTNSTRVTQRLGPHRACPPLRSLFRSAVETFYNRRLF
ncbi:hypothetical protein Hanom_Chr02g00096691 [Helianthus anomalus]